MPLLAIAKINSKLTKDLQPLSATLHQQITTDSPFNQPLLDQLRTSIALLRTALHNAITAVTAEKARLANDIFADRLVHTVFTTIRGDSAAFPQRVYDNHDAVVAAYRAGQRSLDTFEQSLCQEWDAISSMSQSKRENVALLARRKVAAIMAELDKAREREVGESRRLAEEVRNLQGTLRVTEELREATQELEEATQDEFYDAKESQ